MHMCMFVFGHVCVHAGRHVYSNRIRRKRAQSLTSGSWQAAVSDITSHCSLHRSAAGASLPAAGTMHWRCLPTHILPHPSGKRFHVLHAAKFHAATATVVSASGQGAGLSPQYPHDPNHRLDAHLFLCLIVACDSAYASSAGAMHAHSYFDQVAHHHFTIALALTATDGISFGVLSTGVHPMVTCSWVSSVPVAHYSCRRYPDVVVHRLLAAALEADTLQASRGTAVKKGNATASSSSPAATAPAGAAGAGASTRPSSPLSADVVSKVTTEHQLFDCGLAGKVADHCNERRLAARNAQDGSLRLYLTAMLRRFPSVSLATVQPVKGEKWMDVYLHQFGCEAKWVTDWCYLSWWRYRVVHIIPSFLVSGMTLGITALPGEQTQGTGVASLCGL